MASAKLCHRAALLFSLQGQVLKVLAHRPTHNPLYQHYTCLFSAPVAILANDAKSVDQTHVEVRLLGFRAIMIIRNF